jgi:hypothetical protein
VGLEETTIRRRWERCLEGSKKEVDVMLIVEIGFTMCIAQLITCIGFDSLNSAASLLVFAEVSNEPCFG